ncbi:MAG TPA: hypothetical protein VER08_08105 [Pyrinomonadaceae bacterium]|nr:hypothetical protein [Pyrinomonadaceae bacterium]
MKKQHLAAVFATLLLLVSATTAAAANDPVTLDERDTETRMAEAKVVEVTDGRISVIARTGVEHVIAVDSSATKVRLEGRLISLKDVREGDVVTVELDEKNPVKFAVNIDLALPSNAGHVARVRP